MADYSRTIVDLEACFEYLSPLRWAYGFVVFDLAKGSGTQERHTIYRVYLT